MSEVFGVSSVTSSPQSAQYPLLYPISPTDLMFNLRSTSIKHEAPLIVPSFVFHCDYDLLCLFLGRQTGDGGGRGYEEETRLTRKTGLTKEPHNLYASMRTPWA